jgi:hypothetical protein
VEGVADIAATSISQSAAGYGIDRVLDDVLMWLDVNVPSILYGTCAVTRHGIAQLYDSSLR